MNHVKQHSGYHTEQQEVALGDAEREHRDRRSVSDAERVMFYQAQIDAYRRINPRPEDERLWTQAFVAACVRAWRARGETLPATEEQLFIRAYHAKREELDGAQLSSRQQALLRDATRRIWAACPGLVGAVDLPRAA